MTNQAKNVVINYVNMIMVNGMSHEFNTIDLKLNFKNDKLKSFYISKFFNQIRDVFRRHATLNLLNRENLKNVFTWSRCPIDDRSLPAPHSYARNFFAI